MKLEFGTLDLQLVNPWKLSRTSPARVSSVVIIKLVDANGVVGLGEAAPVTRYGESIESVLAFLRKVDLSRLSFERLSESASYINGLSVGDFSAKCAVNVALADGAAKLNRQTIAEFHGLPFSEHKHVTSYTLGIDTPAVMREKAISASAFPIFKIKLGTPGDQEILRAIREVAPEKIVRVDANEGWTNKEQALQMIEWLATDGKVQFVEQPLPASTPNADWLWLKERSPLPLIADESYHFAEDCNRVAECFHGVNVKLVKAGGITPALEALRTARKAGLKTMIGCMIETSILISAAAHLAELCDYLDLDGNLLISNDPYAGVSADCGVLSFANAPERFGLRVAPRDTSYPRL